MRLYSPVQTLYTTFSKNGTDVPCTQIARSYSDGWGLGYFDFEAKAGDSLIINTVQYQYVLVTIPTDDYVEYNYNTNDTRFSYTLTKDYTHVIGVTGGYVMYSNGIVGRPLLNYGYMHCIYEPNSKTGKTFTYPYNNSFGTSFLAF